MRSTVEFVMMAVARGGVIGCALQRSAIYGNSTDVVFGESGHQTIYDLEASAQMLMEKMLGSPQFFKNYNAVKSAKGGKLPIAVIGNIANTTTERIQGRLDAVGVTVRSELYSSNLFEVKDDEATGAIIARITDNIDLGLEDGSLARIFGKHAAPDFLVLGDFRHFADAGNVHTSRLHLAMHNLRTGMIVWEGVQTKVKL